MRTGDGWMRVTTGRERWHEPELAPDGRRVAVLGEQVGLAVFPVGRGEARYLGPASHAAFSPDGRWLVFDRIRGSEDAPRASELAALAVESGRAWNLTQTRDRIERRPELSPDGRALCFDAGGAIWIATFTVRERKGEEKPK